MAVAPFHKVAPVMSAGLPPPETVKVTAVTFTVELLGLDRTICWTKTLELPEIWVELPGGLEPWLAATVTMVGVEEGVNAKVLVGVAVGVKVAVLVAVRVGLLVVVRVAVDVAVLVGVSVSVRVAVLTRVFVGVDVAVLVAVKARVLVGVKVAVEVAV